jgi:hypothetical protein
MGLYSKVELAELVAEFKASIQEAKSGFEKEKEQAFKKAVKAVNKIEKFFSASTEGHRAIAILEKVKDEINNSLKFLKRKEPSENLLNRSIANAARYYDIAVKDFVENFIKSHDNIAHINVLEEDDSEPTAER